MLYSICGTVYPVNLLLKIQIYFYLDECIAFLFLVIALYGPPFVIPSRFCLFSFDWKVLFTGAGIRRDKWSVPTILHGAKLDEVEPSTCTGCIKKCPRAISSKHKKAGRREGAFLNRCDFDSHCSAHLWRLLKDIFFSPLTSGFMPLALSMSWPRQWLTPLPQKKLSTFHFGDSVSVSGRWSPL